MSHLQALSAITVAISDVPTEMIPFLESDPPALLFYTSSTEFWEAVELDSVILKPCWNYDLTSVQLYKKKI